MELLIVVVVLAIVALIALPQFKSGRTDAVCSALAASVTQVTMVLEVQLQKSKDGKWPPSIEPGWFSSRMLPQHPDALAGVPLVETVNTPGAFHPRVKLLIPESPGAYWYNSAEGVFRARVRALASTAETLAFYNTVNNCGLAGMGPGSSGEEDEEDEGESGGEVGALDTVGALAGDLREL